jgi:hypothetical protein
MRTTRQSRTKVEENYDEDIEEEEEVSQVEEETSSDGMHH